MKKILLLLLTATALISVLCLSSHTAEAAEWTETVFTASGFDYLQYMHDDNYNTYGDSEGSGNATITLSNPDGISHIYVVFHRIYGEWTLTDTSSGKSETVGKNEFLHEYINVEELFGKSATELQLSFESNAYVADVYGFTDGELPGWVQIWDAPLEKADILLLSSHSDDEQLFFAGILPYYGVERGVDVQVVYLISHFDTTARPHEQLNGLWTVGIRNYPIISDFPDLYSESLEGAKNAFEAQGFTYNDFTSFIVENTRRFKPQVLITHDINGEYGHGTHIYCTDVVMNSLESIPDATFCPESAEKYGTWDVPKTYFHLYEENQITLDWDTPFDSLGGNTPFEITVRGFDCHLSQHWTWFNEWIRGTEAEPITKASQITDYSPCIYGLYRTTVGPDTIGGDFLENIVPYGLQQSEEPDNPVPPQPDESVDSENSAPEKDEAVPSDSEKEDTSDNTSVKPSSFSNRKTSVIPFIVICSSFVIGVLLILILCILSTRKPKKHR